MKLESGTAKGINRIEGVGSGVLILGCRDAFGSGFRISDARSLGARRKFGV